MKQIKLEIQLTPDDHDSDDVYFMLGKKQVGYGYRGKDSGQINIMRCPKCGRENYALAVSTGYCAFCRFNANPARNE